MSLPAWIELLTMPARLHATCCNGHSIESGDTFAIIDDEVICRECLAMFNE